METFIANHYLKHFTNLAPLARIKLFVLYLNVLMYTLLYGMSYKLMIKLNVIIIILIKFHNFMLMLFHLLQKYSLFLWLKLIIVIFFSFFNFLYLLTNFIKLNNKKTDRTEIWLVYCTYDE